MSFPEMVVIIVAITSAARVMTEIARARGRYRRSHSSSSLSQVWDELRALRGEINELKQRGHMTSGPAVHSRPVSGDVENRVRMLEDEVASLRDTTTQFDMSFDAALDRLERRVNRVHDVLLTDDGAESQRVTTNGAVASAAANYAPKTSDESQTVQMAGRG